ncbi:MAG TPA: IclR family transcriptional regulator [Thermodesulfobacteriota bacterium]
MSGTNGSPADSPVVRALRILAAVAGADAPLSLAELSRAVGLPKATVHRLAALVEGEGLIERDPLARRYVVAGRFDGLALNALRTAPVHRNRRAVLKRLSERLGETVNLGVLHGGEVMYLERVESSWPLRMELKPGSRVPIHCTAIGKLLLAFAPKAVRERLLMVAALEPRTGNTLTSRARLEDELAVTRARGHSEDNEEFLAGVCCVAVPVRDGRGKVLAGLAVSAPSARLPLARAREHLGDLRAAADQLGAYLEASREGRGRS